MGNYGAVRGSAINPASSKGRKRDMKDVDQITLTYSDSRRPGLIWMSLGGREGYRPLLRHDTVTMTPADAVALAGRLLEAVRASNYELTARKRVK